MKLASLALAGLMLAGTMMPALAYENSTANVDATAEITAPVDAEECEVYAEVGSDFTVTIPKKITLDGATKTGSYTVSCTGNIAGDEYVSVTPDAQFAMKQAGKADVTASVTQETTKFRDNLFTGTKGAGEALMSEGASATIDAAGLTAGEWNGIFNFAINLNQDVAQ